jgi:hypothetical protein
MRIEPHANAACIFAPECPSPLFCGRTGRPLVWCRGILRRSGGGLGPNPLGQKSVRVSGIRLSPSDDPGTDHPFAPWTLTITQSVAVTVVVLLGILPSGPRAPLVPTVLHHGEPLPPELWTRLTSIPSYSMPEDPLFIVRPVDSRPSAHGARPRGMSRHMWVTIRQSRERSLSRPSKTPRTQQAPINVCSKAF